MAKISGNKWLRQRHDTSGTFLDAAIRTLSLFVALQPVLQMAFELLTQPLVVSLGAQLFRSRSRSAGLSTYTRAQPNAVAISFLFLICSNHLRIGRTFIR